MTPGFQLQMTLYGVPQMVFQAHCCGGKLICLHKAQLFIWHYALQVWIQFGLIRTDPGWKMSKQQCQGDGGISQVLSYATFLALMQMYTTVAFISMPVAHLVSDLLRIMHLAFTICVHGNSGHGSLWANLQVENAMWSCDTLEQLEIETRTCKNPKLFTSEFHFMILRAFLNKVTEKA